MIDPLNKREEWIMNRTTFMSFEEFFEESHDYVGMFCGIPILACDYLEDGEIAFRNPSPQTRRMIEKLKAKMEDNDG